MFLLDVLTFAISRYLKVVNSGIRWTSKKLTQLYTEETDLNNELSRTELSLVKDAVEIASTFVPVFEDVAFVVAQLDVLST